MTIPECRDALLSIANSLAIKANCSDEAKGIRVIVKEMERRAPVRKARGESPGTMTPGAAQADPGLRQGASRHDVPRHRIGLRGRRRPGVGGARGVQKMKPIERLQKVEVMARELTTPLDVLVAANWNDDSFSPSLTRAP